MAKKQLKHVKVLVETQGAKEANVELATLDKHVDSIDKGFKRISKNSGLKSIATAAKSLQSVNRALDGSTQAVTKKLSNYLDNIELTSISLGDLAKHSAQAAKSLASTNKSLAASRGLQSYAKNISALVTQISALSKGNLEGKLKNINSSIRSMNKAMNGGTKASKKNLDAYIKGISEVKTALNELSTSASTANSRIMETNTTMAMAKGSAGSYEDSLGDIAHTLDLMLESMEQARSEMRDIGDAARLTAKNVAQLDNSLDETNESLGSMGDGFRGTREHLKKTGNQAQKTGKKLADSFRAGSSRARAFGDLAFGMNPLVSMYAAIAVNVYALTEAFRVLNDAAGIARLEETTASFSAAISGLNVKALAQDLQEASAGALDLQNALKFATKGVAFSFTTQQLKDLTDGARRASIALGINFNDAMDRVTRGISKQEIELFDELGIVTRLTPAFEKLASQLGKNVDQLTNYERQLALTNEVQRQLEEKYSGVAKYATGWERLGVAVQDLTHKILKGSASAMDKQVDSMGRYLQTLVPITTETKKAAESLKIYNEAMADGKVLQAAMALNEYEKFSTMTTVQLRKAKDAQEEQVASVTQLNKVVTYATIGLGAYLGILKGIPLAMTAAAFVTQAYGAVIGVASVATKAFASVLGLVRMGALAYVATGSMAATVSAGIAAGMASAAGATRAFALATAMAAWPLLLGAAAIAGLGYAAWKLADQFGLAEKASDGFSSMVDYVSGKVKELTKTILGVDTDDSMKEISKLKKELEGMGHVSEDTGTKLNNMYQKLANKGIKLTSPAEGEQQASEEAKKKVQQFYTAYAKAATKTNGVLMSSGEMYRAELAKQKKIIQDKRQAEINAALASIKSLGDATQAVADTARGMRIARTETERLFDEVSKIKSIGENELVKIGGIAEMEKAAEELSKALGMQVTVEGLPNLLSTLDTMISKSKQFKETMERRTQVDYRTSLSFYRDRHKASAEMVAIQREINNLSVSNLGAQGGINEAKVKELQLSLDLLSADEKRAKILQSLKDSETREVGSKDIKGLQLAHRAKVDNSPELAVAIKQNELDIEKTQLEHAKEIGDLSNQDYITQLQILAVKQQLLDKEGEVVELRRQASVFDQIGKIDGISAMQGAVAGLGSTMTTMFADMKEQGENFSIADIFEADSERLIEVANSMTSVIGSIYGAISDAKVAGYDREIEAEKRRDGKSAESLAKIKKLEAKKIREEGKAKKLQVIMSTSVAAAKALELGPILGPVMAGMMIGMGAFQLAQIDKAMGGQLAGLSAPSGNLSLTGGNSKNAVDVSRNSTSSEYSNAAGLPTRASGGTVYSDVEVGERGPERISPQIPVSVSDAGDSASSSNLPSIHLNLNMDNLDSKSMEDRLPDIASALVDTLEEELNTRNLSLENLG
jgi:hypothetical protein